jgi:hypothetical protein
VLAVKHCVKPVVNGGITSEKKKIMSLTVDINSHNQNRMENMKMLTELVEEKNRLDNQKREIQADLWRLEEEVIELLIDKRMQNMLKVNWQVLLRFKQDY